MICLGAGLAATGSGTCIRTFPAGIQGGEPLRNPEIPAGGYGEGTMTARSGGWTGGAWSALSRAVTYVASLRQRRAVKDLTRRRSWIEQARQAPTVQQLMERKAALASRPDDGR